MSAKRETVAAFKRFEIERAAGEGARAPSTNRLVPDRIDFLVKATVVVSLITFIFGRSLTLRPFRTSKSTSEFESISNSLFL